MRASDKEMVTLRERKRWGCLVAWASAGGASEENEWEMFWNMEQTSTREHLSIVIISLSLESINFWHLEDVLTLGPHSPRW